MPLKDQIKNVARKFIEDRPDATALKKLTRPRKPLAVRFADDGIVPNNPRLPSIVYRGAIAVDRDGFDAAAVIDALFELNGWTRSWRDTVYNFVHYHSQIHEVLGVSKGSAKLECGGVKGRVLYLKAGDVIVLPAGTGHRLIESTRDFKVVGAYPKTGTYDEVTDTRDRIEAKKRISKVRKPLKDPVYGRMGPLSRLWGRSRSREG